MEQPILVSDLWSLIPDHWCPSLDRKKVGPQVSILRPGKARG